MAFEVSVNEQAEHPVITLRDTVTGSEAEIYSFGAMLNGFRVTVKEELCNVVDGFLSVDDAKKNILNGFKSAKLSPFVCRMRKGSYLFAGKTYQVQKHYLGEHAIHGLIFDSVYSITDTESDSTKAAVTLEHLYTGTDQGFPFQYHITVNWKLEAGNRLSVATSVSHYHAEPIPFADGWHPYFTLGGEVDSWKLQFNSHTQLVYDEDLLPTGEKITDTRFEKSASLQGISLDNSFEFDENPSRCILSNDGLRLIIEPDKTYPILQVYTPPSRKSIAIENLTGAPDNFNNELHLLWLPPGEIKTFITRYQIEIL